MSYSTPIFVEMRVTVRIAAKMVTGTFKFV